jgi:hypothetical protein
VHPLFILIVLLAIVFTVRWVKTQPPQKRQKAGFMAAVLGAGTLLLVALATGRLNPLVAAVAAAIPVMQRLTWAKSILDTLRSTVKGNENSDPVMATAWLRIKVSPETGDWTGVIIDGPHKGEALSALDASQLWNLLEVYRRDDPKSAELLENYLVRNHHDARSGPDSEPSRPATIPTMSSREARQVLGVSESATEDEIVATHRRLMQRMHPDRGGSDYLASKINQAKDRLLSSGH